MKIVSFSLEQGNKYFGKVDQGPKFLIGSRVTYQGNKGLMNTVGTPSDKYDRVAFRPAYGVWADFIHPTAVAEGALYHTLNTYDRARFTFTFLQYAAHVPNGDFVVFLRALLRLPAAADYFPDLALDSNNRICKVDVNGLTPLESKDSTDLLMDYFNPSSTEVEDTEVIQAAKLVHWSREPDHRDLQIKVGIDHFQSKMKTYAKWYPALRGASPQICLMVADIHHQGRAKTYEVRMALQDSDPLSALLKIGADQYAQRIATLTKEIKALTTGGAFANLRYDVDSNTFV